MGVSLLDEAAARQAVGSAIYPADHSAACSPDKVRERPRRTTGEVVHRRGEPLALTVPHADLGGGQAVRERCGEARVAETGRPPQGTSRSTSCARGFRGNAVSVAARSRGVRSRHQLAAERPEVRAFAQYFGAAAPWPARKSYSTSNAPAAPFDG